MSSRLTVVKPCRLKVTVYWPDRQIFESVEALRVAHVDGRAADARRADGLDRDAGQHRAGGVLDETANAAGGGLCRSAGRSQRTEQSETEGADGPGSEVR